MPYFRCMESPVLHIDLIVPCGWNELNDKPLRYAFGLIAKGFTFDEIKTLCLFRWSGLSVRHRHNAGFVCRFRRQDFIVSADQIAEVSRLLNGSTPYRRSRYASLVSVATAHSRPTSSKCRLKNSSSATTSTKALIPMRFGETIVGDITYIPIIDVITGERSFCYANLIMDSYSKVLLGSGQPHQIMAEARISRR